MPAHFHRQFTERFGFGLLDGYGSTETNCIMGAPLAEQRPGCMGRLLSGFSARVVDAHDNEVPDGEAGELMLRADEPFAFATGYFGMAGQDRGGVAQSLVPHRRSRGARERRLIIASSTA